MNISHSLRCVLVGLSLWLTQAVISLSLHAADPVKVLLVTGGHPFEKAPFFKMFDELSGITLTKAEHAKDSASVWDRDDLGSFNVVVLYDMPLKITESQKKNFLVTVDRGIGLVVLHHALVSYPDWPEYEHIIGGRYPKPPNGQPQVTADIGYHHDEEVPVVVLAKDHPITMGLQDFTIHDEIYWGFRVGSDVTPLLTTTHPKSGKPLAWTRTSGKSKIVYMQFGHDHQAWEHPNYPILLARCIEWARP